MVAEARSADELVLTRRCVIMKVPDFTTEKYLQAQKQNAAAILILLPKNISGISHDTLQVTGFIQKHSLCSRTGCKTTTTRQYLGYSSEYDNISVPQGIR